jgi:tRNA modification GTPase
LAINELDDTIVANSTASGGAVAMIRVSGKDSITIVERIFKGKKLSKQPSHTVHYGQIIDNDKIIDDVVATIFVAPKSYTKENVVEITCHGSDFIVQEIIKLIIKNGARFAHAGEFTKRAFLNGQLDLAQAEAVADLIASDSAAAHQVAIKQMRGGFSDEIKILREKLIHFASLIELELDFAEEDVEFANRDDLKKLIYELISKLDKLINSFSLGNAIKKGVPVVIAGKPNAGKSTLLNTLLNEDKAIVSEIAGTTRDFIEDELNIAGISFRFIDTAGLRDTTDTVEAIGVERSIQKINAASIVIFLFDVNNSTVEELQTAIDKLSIATEKFLLVGNKVDLNSNISDFKLNLTNYKQIYISAKNKENIEQLKLELLNFVQIQNLNSGETIVTNLRHYESLVNAKQALEDVIKSIDLQVSGDFMAIDIRKSLHYLGLITGEITTEDLLENIFSKFCIGK